jgi:hypothetical protein
VHAPRPEVDHGTPIRRVDHARRLGGQDGRQVHLVHDEGLDHLRLGNRSLDLKDRLVGEDRRALRHGEDIAFEAKIGQSLKKVRRELLDAPEIGEVIRRKSQLFQIVQNRRQATGEKVIAGRRQAPDEEAEDGKPVHPLGPIALQHREFVLIGEKGESALPRPDTHAGPSFFCGTENLRTPQRLRRRPIPAMIQVKSPSRDADPHQCRMAENIGGLEALRVRTGGAPGRDAMTGHARHNQRVRRVTRS